MKIDASPQSDSDIGPGIYLAEIKACELKYSKKKQAYFNVRWHDAGLLGSGDLICWDVLMLEGAGRGMGVSKLKVLGFEEVITDTLDGKRPMIDAEPEDLVGRRAWIRVGHEEYQGKMRLKVIAEFDPAFSSGYWHENTPPDGVSKATVDLEDAPF